MTFYIQLFILRLEYGLRIVKFSVFSKLFLYLSTNRCFLQPPPQKRPKTAMRLTFFKLLDQNSYLGKL